MQQSVRLHVLARELSIDSKVIIAKCQDEGFVLRNHMALVGPDLADLIRDWFIHSPPPVLRPSELFERIEVNVLRLVLAELAKEANASGLSWWYDFVPEPIRISCATRQEQERGRIQEKHAYLDFIDLKTIIERNWKLFQDRFESVGLDRSKSKALEWMDKLNELRRLFGHPLKAHVSKRKPADSDIALLQECDALVRRVLARQ